MPCVAGVKTGEVPGRTKMQRVKEGFPDTKTLNNGDHYVRALGIAIPADVKREVNKETEEQGRCMTCQVCSAN